MLLTKPFHENSSSIQPLLSKITGFRLPVGKYHQKAAFTPEQTYLSWQGFYEMCDNRLICIYQKGSDLIRWAGFRNTVIGKNPFFEFCDEPANENYAVVTFNLDPRQESFQAIASGKYSKILPDMKSLILMCHGINTGEHAYMESFLYPEKFTDVYADLYDVRKEFLVQVGELIDKPNAERNNSALIFPGKK